MTDELFKVYEELAKGGAGTIFTSYAHVEKSEQPGLLERQQQELRNQALMLLKLLVVMIHHHRLFLQVEIEILRS